MRNSIRTRLAITFIALAVGLLLLVGIVLAWQSYVNEQEQALNLQSERAQRISSQVLSFMQIQENALTGLVSVRGLNGLNREQQTQLLSELIASSDVFSSLALIDGGGQEKIHVSSTEITDQLQNLSAADEFTIPKSTKQIYYGPVQFSENSGEPYIVIAVPITDVRSGDVTNVLSAEVRLKPVWDLLASTSLGVESNAYIVDSSDRVVAHNNPSVVLRNTLFTVPEQDGVHTGVSGSSVVLATDPINLGGQLFTVVTETSAEEAFASIVRTELTIFGLLVIAMTIAGVLGWFAAGQIVRPIEALATTAHDISMGDLTKQADVTRRDEIGDLADAFNRMTAQLRDLIGSLEKRVEERTRALTTSTEVSRRLSTILDEKQLVKAVVEQVQDAFDFYHVHIYLRDEASGNLIMAGGTGDAGAAMLARGHKILKGKGLVGRAAETNSAVLVQDTSQDPNWLPNPLLPDTKSEVAVPISIGADVLGVLDVQENIVSGLNQEDVDLLQSIANQVAIGVRNARSYEESRSQAELETLINTIGQKIQRAGTVEDVLQTAIREMGMALGASRVSASLQPGGTATESYDAGGGNGADPKR
jgi:HAMP domain-containing protein